MWKAISCCVALLAVGSWYLISSWSLKTQTPKSLNPQYDYIIVGGGSAGCVLAARLSEDPETTVLLLEAGPADFSIPFVSHIPLLGALLQQTSIDWQFLTVPQNMASLGMNEKKTRWPRGKVLGGSSVLNQMLHARATKDDHDKWEKELGKEWGWEAMLPYYKKLENARFQGADENLRGKAGNINCVLAPETTIGIAFLNATEETGYQTLKDFNGKNKKGFARAQLSTKNGVRQSTMTSYLRPALGRFNLHVVPGAHVTKINFNEDGGVVGVDYSYENKMMRVLTNKEVILSAGAVGSPHILMLSGIGPEKHLKQFQIPLVVDSQAVGKNLQDHVISSILIKVNESVGVDARTIFSVSQGIKAVWEYVIRGEGLLSWPVAELVGHFNSGMTDDKNELDIQGYLFPTDVWNQGFFNYLVNINDETAKTTHANLDNQPSITISSGLLHPKSSGTISLASKDPFIPPRIDPKYLSIADDTVVLAKGLMLMLEILKAPSLAKYKPQIAEGILNGCSTFEPWSQEYLQCFVSHKLFTLYHPIGTCKMGRLPFENSVVDRTLRVHGVKGLRVVDASVFPYHVSANTNIPVIALAEKAADMIRSS